VKFGLFRPVVKIKKGFPGLKGLLSNQQLKIGRDLAKKEGLQK
jgi:hypothetical protein